MKSVSLIAAIAFLLLIPQHAKGQALIINANATVTVHSNINLNCQDLTINSGGSLVVDGGYVSGVDSLNLDPAGNFQLLNGGYISDCSGNPDIDSGITGLVFDDADGDGVFDFLETGFPGVTIDLIEDQNGNGVIDSGESVYRTATTNSDGAFVFADLPAGSYILDVTDTAGILDSYGLTAGADPMVVLLSNSQVYDQADFGYQMMNASIGDLVYYDANSNGVFDTGEPGVEGVTLVLIRDADGNGHFNAGDSILTSTSTDNDGAYDFTSLLPGSYIVDMTGTGSNLSGYLISSANEPLPVVLDISQDFNDADFGFAQNDGSFISGLVFGDMNGNGAHEAGEPGIPGVAINLLSYAFAEAQGCDPLMDVVTTDANGHYSFSGLATGSYTIDVADTSLPGYGLTAGEDPLPVMLTLGQSVTDAYFGYRAQTASIAGYVYLDANDNGLKDPAEVGIAEVTISLRVGTDPDTAGPPMASQTTAPDGSYIFSSLASGNYLVDITDANHALARLRLTSDADPRVLSLADSETLTGVDFGYAEGNAAFLPALWLLLFEEEDD